MRPIDRARAVLATGVLALWMGLTDAMLKYLKPSMRPWLVTAGFGLAAIGLVAMLRARARGVADHDGDHHGASPRIGWLLVVPALVVILFGANSLGGFAVSRGTGDLPPYSFDIAAYAESTGQSPLVLKLSDIENGVRQGPNRAFLAAHDVRFAGFVNHAGALGPGSFMVTRFLVSCCAADAIPVSVTIVGADHVPADEQWLDITARLDPSRTARVDRGDSGVVMRLVRLTPIAEPSGPYETLRST